MAYTPDKKWTTAHRVAWILFKGPIPEGLHVLHHCDNRICVEIKHLWVGTNYENVLDKMAKGRAKGGTGAHWMLARRDLTHCKRGHEFTEANVIQVPYKGRYLRHCRECQAMHSRAYRRRLKET